MKIVIAMKLRGYWTQTELKYDIAEGIMKHDNAFEEILLIENGKLKRMIRPIAEPSLAEHHDNPEVPQSTPQ